MLAQDVHDLSCHRYAKVRANQHLLDLIPIDGTPRKFLDERLEKIHVVRQKISESFLNQERVNRGKCSPAVIASMRIVGRFSWRGLAKRPRQIVFDPVENPIDEAAGIGSAESFGQFDRFVDRDDGRNVVAVKHFIDRQRKTFRSTGEMRRNS